MDNWLGINEFVAVVDTSSFTKATKQLNTSVAQVSRKVASLEQRLSTKLLLRTTRKITVTEAGAHYFKHCQSLIEGLKQADLALSNLSQLPKGLLTVTAPITYGEQIISPLLNRFMKQYPDLKLKLILSNQTLDLIKDNIDLAVRIGYLEDSTMMAKKLSQRQLRVCASPDYIEQYGTPFSLSELQHHNCLIGSSSLWAFQDHGNERNIRIKGNITCNSGFALLDAAIKSIGLVQLPDYYVDQALKEGKLIECLTAYRPPLQKIWAMYPNNRYLSVKVSLLIAFLTDELSNE
ncbi:LysR substrate-binding domain-containing protein [Psychromonas sp. KJ10-10]|uniref:LysR substrate-binding domain-containing protein n=1 Tax=Psychromonas sp. KJ10-10 TaxID=3391823 RepID=UPI0039B4E875